MSEALKPSIPYMVRSVDGVILRHSGDDIHPYIWRNPKSISIDDSIKQIDDRCEWGMFKWFYDNTNNDSTRELVRKFIITNYLYSYNTDDISALLKMPFDITEIDCEPYLFDGDETQLRRHTVRNRVFEELNNATNQEFMRVRVGDMYHDSRSGNSVYFRISSFGYDWLPIIRDIVDNHANIQYITITPDLQSFYGTRTKNISAYELDGEPCLSMPRKDFMLISNRNVVESKQRKSYTLRMLARGNSIRESFLYGNDRYILETYNTLKRKRWEDFLNGERDIGCM